MQSLTKRKETLLFVNGKRELLKRLFNWVSCVSLTCSWSSLTDKNRSCLSTEVKVTLMLISVNECWRVISDGSLVISWRPTMISKLCKRDLRASWINRSLRWMQALIRCHRCHRKWTIQIKILKSTKKCLMTSRQGSKLISTQRKWSNVSRSS